jgi:hypothetical protein
MDLDTPAKPHYCQKQSMKPAKNKKVNRPHRGLRGDCDQEIPGDQLLKPTKKVFFVSIPHAHSCRVRHAF